MERSKYVDPWQQGFEMRRSSYMQIFPSKYTVGPPYLQFHIPRWGQPQIKTSIFNPWLGIREWGSSDAEGQVYALFCGTL